MAKILDKLAGALGYTPANGEEPNTGLQQPKQDGDPMVQPAPANRGRDDASRKRVSLLDSVLMRYIDGKKQLDERIVENDKWYRSRQWEIFQKRGGQEDKKEPEPVSNFLWNTLANRHGELMDAFPEPVFTEREESDKSTADELSKVTKVVLDRNKYRRSYSAAAWYKIKSGLAAYGVFWDQSKDGGVGDINIRKIDILRLFWEPGISDLQDSSYVFHVSLENFDRMKAKYPVLVDSQPDGQTVGFKKFAETDPVDLKDKVKVVDCYYKEVQPPFANEVMHLDKYASGVMLFSTKWPTADGGKPQWYAHGKYPFVIDVCYPEEGTIGGFGVVDVIKSPQMYIDKLNQIIIRNAFTSGRNRYLVKQGAFPTADLMDLSKDVVEVQGSLREGEDYAILRTEALPQPVMAHRDMMVSELKEISGANDFNRGSSSGGVTAASAIMALQEAGNKLARAMVTSTYDAYTEICYLVLELISQFYTEDRKFRITNSETNQPEYISFNNQNLQEQPMISPDGMQLPSTRKPIFDIVVHAEKYSPYAALAANEMAKELFAAGMFNPEQAPAAKIALDLMSFEGKERIVRKVEENYMMVSQVGQIQQQNSQLMQMLGKMNEVIKQSTGMDMLAGSGLDQATMVGQPQQEPGTAGQMMASPAQPMTGGTVQ